MKLLLPRTKFEILLDGKTVEFKTQFQYIVPDAFVENILGSNPQFKNLVNVQQFHNLKEIPEKPDYNNKKILLTRTGGRGDFFFILRSIKEIREKYSNVHITFCCGNKYVEMVKNVLGIYADRVLPIPFTIVEYDKCDYFVTFENLIETNPIASKRNAFEMVSDLFKIELTGGYGLDISLPLKFWDWANLISSTWKRPVIGIQPRASAILRSYPLPYLAKLIKLLDESGYDVLFLDKKEVIQELIIKPEMQGIRVLLPFTNEIDGSFELCVALASKCKVIVSPDSIFTYIGDSLRVPTIVLYSPFSSVLRAKNLDIFAIDVVDGCYNCCVHSYTSCKYSMDSYSPCLKKIKPELVLEVIKKVINNVI